VRVKLPSAGRVQVRPATGAARQSRGALLALQRSAGNVAVRRMLAAQSARGLDGRVLARHLDGWIDSGEMAAVPLTATYSYNLQQIVGWNDDLRRAIKEYNKLAQPYLAKPALAKVLELIETINQDLQWLVPGLSRDVRSQSAADKASYAALVRYQNRLTALSKKANDEATGMVGVQRKGPGKRPDAMTEQALVASIGTQGLSTAQRDFLTRFVTTPGNWKEIREAFSAIWAKQQGMFTDIEPGKPNDYGADVEYTTADTGKPELWDQKTIYSHVTAFDGRVGKTHKKNTDDQGHGVGILFDSTYEGSQNYEQAWVAISQLLLTGQIPPDAVKEVRAPNSGAALRADIFVDLTVGTVNPDVEEDGNIRWAEREKTGAQVGGLETIATAKVNAKGLNGIVAGTTTPFARYTNNRNWLPDGVYDEYPATGFSNDGKARFVITSDSRKRHVYLSVTHYKGFTLRTGTGNVNRNPFYKIV